MPGEPIQCRSVTSHLDDDWMIKAKDGRVVLYGKFTSYECKDWEEAIKLYEEMTG